MITIEEHITSRNFVTQAGKAISCELVYLVTGTDYHAYAYVNVYQFAPKSFEWLNRQSITLEPLVQDENNPDMCRWLARVEYNTSPLPEDKYLIPKYSFDTSGGTQHITQSIGTMHAYPSNAPDFGGAIGVSDNNVVGVNITVPNLNINISQVFPREIVTPSYMAYLARLTGKINKSAFMDFAPGEVLFMGASGSTSDSDCEISFKFAICENRYNFKVGDIVVKEKWGWDYMWVRYLDQLDKSGNIIKVPSAVYIEEVYFMADFRALGLNV